ncbi:16S rRNA (uracil(1498)-N(3))-methyltransferase [Fodinisporobacter ferrooxydans]|uniref:Ribosomal RNA small subunit methyltransferase E n=1 Tax=Fodinisporobacter ferrooxydans TaxID=2901836 RepID=A0ABY4CEF9_9BACL|nr:16S rRNA (uracil(1498)-N(3))-methyltransferase [Alicyclobacillaceae bacterium MYW30-H2]
MQRYFVERSQVDLANGLVRITGDDVKHITRVLRMKPGDTVIVSDGCGTSCTVALKELQEFEVIGDIRHSLQSREPQVKITLVQGLPKGDKMDLIVQKGTEIGVSEIIPVETARSIVKYDEKKQTKAVERWRKIAKEAAEQAHRDAIPAVQRPQPLRQWMNKLSQYDLVLVPYEGEIVQTMQQILRTAGPIHRICIAIGPEGGWDDGEIAEFLALHAQPVTLGPRILRTETAGLVAAAVILYEYGEMGGV